MTMLRALPLLLIVASCNPAQRCVTAADCPANGTCSGGYCADGPYPYMREDPVDLDGPDAGMGDAGQPALKQQDDGGPLVDRNDAG
jgi:hypothetical protein